MRTAYEATLMSLQHGDEKNMEDLARLSKAVEDAALKGRFSTYINDVHDTQWLQDQCEARGYTVSGHCASFHVRWV